MAVRILQHNNMCCLKCGCVYEHMVRIGAYVMCENCFIYEFGPVVPDQIERNTTDYNNKYVKWLNVYKEKNKEE